MKMFINSECKMTFSDKQKLKEFITSISVLHETLREVIWAEEKLCNYGSTQRTKGYFKILIFPFSSSFNFSET